MVETRQCPQRSAELPEGAPEGLCPRCLLGPAFQAATDVTMDASATVDLSRKTQEPEIGSELAQTHPSLNVVRVALDPAGNSIAILAMALVLATVFVSRRVIKRLIPHATTRQDLFPASATTGTGGGQ
jgi:hypothetical protein